MCDVSRQSCKAVLKSGPGRSIAIVIGGASESLNARPGVMDLTIKKRLGFVKIAVETGASMVPVINFGENDLYEQVKNDDGSWLRKLQTKTQRLAGFTLPLFHGRGVFNCKHFLFSLFRLLNRFSFFFIFFFGKRIS